MTSVVEFIKAKALPVGTVRTWKNGKRMIKTADGWKPHSSGGMGQSDLFGAEPERKKKQEKEVALNPIQKQLARMLGRGYEESSAARILNVSDDFVRRAKAIPAFKREMADLEEYYRKLKGEGDAQASLPTHNGSLEVADYTGRAIIVRGDTMANVDFLRAIKEWLGFGSYVRSAGGWVFPKKAEGKIKAALDSRRAGLEGIPPTPKPAKDNDEKLVNVAIKEIFDGTSGAWTPGAFVKVPGTDMVVKVKPRASGQWIGKAKKITDDLPVFDSPGEYIRDAVEKQKQADDARKEAERVASQEVAEQSKSSEPEGGVSDDEDRWSSENYRYKDTGYIPGARKENAESIIRRYARDGKQVAVQSIDWTDLEENPRAAEGLIVKSNLFGSVDWDSLRADGMEPGAGFLLDRIYAMLPPKPPQNTDEGRYYYTLALQTLRERLEKSKTPDELTRVLDEIREEATGYRLSAEEEAQAKQIESEAKNLRAGYLKYRDVVDRAYQESLGASGARSRAQWNIDKRKRRGWKIRPEDQKALDDANAAYEKAHAAWSNALNVAEYKEDLVSRVVGSTPLVNIITGEKTGREDVLEYDRTSPYREKIKALHAKRKAIEEQAMRRHAATDQFKTWAVGLGDKVERIVTWSGYKGSAAFKGHVAVVKAGQIKDWSWLHKDKAPRKATKSRVAFQLKVAEKYERVGGRKVGADSTMALKESYGLRDVQSGNWVLKDLQSASFHVQKSAEAFSDLADIIGVDDKEISLHGELALAFGARGKGFLGGKAHYEPAHRVINITKIGGGGSLGHEWFHALDNLISEMEKRKGGQEIKEDEWGSMASESPSIISHAGIRDAFSRVVSAMRDGDLEETTQYSYTDKDFALARANLSNVDWHSGMSLAKSIKNSASVEDAISTIEGLFPQLGKYDKAPKGYDGKRFRAGKKWIQIAVAHFGGEPGGGTIRAKTGRKISSFLHESQKLEGGSEYWATTHEMIARAFQSYCEDKLESMGRKNDYLSAMADNKYYRSPLGDPKPFPEGKERERINAAMEDLLGHVRESGILSEVAKTMKSMRIRDSLRAFVKSKRDTQRAPLDFLTASR